MPARVAKNATLRLGATTPARVTKSTILELTKKGFSGTMLPNHWYPIQFWGSLRPSLTHQPPQVRQMHGCGEISYGTSYIQNTNYLRATTSADEKIAWRSRVD